MDAFCNPNRVEFRHISLGSPIKFKLLVMGANKAEPVLFFSSNN